jgi:hypothetical protein
VDAPAAAADRPASTPADAAPVDAAASSRDTGARADAAVDAGSGGADFAPVAGTWTGMPGVYAVGDDGRCAHSTDGKMWAACPGTMTPARGSAPDKTFRRVAYANQTLVAVATGNCDLLMPTKCTTSVAVYDGTTWKTPPVPAEIGRLRDVAFGNGVWTAVGTLGPAIYSLDNGETWQKVPSFAQRLAPGLLDVAFGRVGEAEIFVAVGERYVRAMSRDGINWVETAAPSQSDQLDDVAIGNGVAVAVGGSSTSGVRMRTANGKDWTDLRTGGPDILSVLFADGRFWAFSNTSGNTVHVSADGSRDSWSTMIGTTFTIPPATTMLPAQPERLGTVKIDGKTTFIGRRAATNQPTEIRTSTDGLNWTAVYREMSESSFGAFVHVTGM